MLVAGLQPRTKAELRIAGFHPPREAMKGKDKNLKDKNLGAIGVILNYWKPWQGLLKA